MDHVSKWTDYTSFDNKFPGRKDDRLRKLSYHLHLWKFEIINKLITLSIIIIIRGENYWKTTFPLNNLESWNSNLNKSIKSNWFQERISNFKYPELGK